MHVISIPSFYFEMDKELQTWDHDLKENQLAETLSSKV